MIESKQINGYDNYFVQQDGKVYNSNTDSYLTGSIGPNGYKYYRLSRDNQKKLCYEHRLVAEAFIENPNHLPIVHHIDGNKLNNNVENLAWTDYSTNVSEWHKNKNSNLSKENILETEINEAEEEWKNIPEFPNYLISNFGRVKSLKRDIILKQSISSGYFKVVLCENGQTKDSVVHRLLYSVFNNDWDLKNYIIDHIDGNKLNNHITNLKKVTTSENVKNALYSQNLNHCNKKVAQYDLQGNLIQTFQSVSQAGEILKIDKSSIAKVCRGYKYKSAGGYIFKYI